jgi:hypothetical protein
MRLLLLISALVLFATGCQTVRDDAYWQILLRERLPLYGHRNFIVVADAAYPLQVNPGIHTILAKGEHLDVLDFVLGELEQSGHVRPIVWLDAELNHVPEEDAKGVGQMRDAITQHLAGFDVRRASHEEIIRRLDKTADLFQVLLLKTNLKIPYTSVFFELDCGYWDSASEQKLRQSMAKKERD